MEYNLMVKCLQTQLNYFFSKYSATSLKRTLAGQKLLSALERCPLWRGYAMRVFLSKNLSGTNDIVRLREVSALEVSALGRFHCSKFLGYINFKIDRNILE